MTASEALECMRAGGQVATERRCGLFGQFGNRVYFSCGDPECGCENEYPPEEFLREFQGDEFKQE
jgi:hypothetical protein